MPPERVLAAMETGSMITMANDRTAAERRAIAEFLTGKSLSTPLVTTPPPRAMCTRRDRARSIRGAGPRGRLGPRHLEHAVPGRRTAGLAAADVPKLKLKWAFAFPGDLQSYAQSTIAGGRVFVGSWGGKVYSLNAATGCIHWFFDAGAGRALGHQHRPRQTASGARVAVFFGDGRRNRLRAWMPPRAR